LQLFSNLLFHVAGGHNVALEIQATIPVGNSKPLSTIPDMMKGVNVTFLVSSTAAAVDATAVTAPTGCPMHCGCISICMLFWFVAAARVEAHTSGSLSVHCEGSRT
jgi:hypothetical protein